MKSWFMAVLVGAAALTGCVSSPGSGGGGVGTGQGFIATGCGASNCAGCCANGVCQSGTTSFSCGHGGSVCGSCSGIDVCFTDGTCGIDPSSKWKLHPLSASIESTNNGSSWDGDGSPPDVVVHTFCPPTGTPGATSVELESYAPQWEQSGGCIATAGDLMNLGFTFDLDDVDVLSDDSITSKLAHKVSSAELRSGYISLGAANGMKNINFQLDAQ